MEFEIGKEYKSQVKVKVGPIWMKMRMDFVLDSPTTFHGKGSGAFNNYTFDNGTIEGEATSPGNKPLICKGGLLPD